MTSVAAPCWVSVPSSSPCSSLVRPSMLISKVTTVGRMFRRSRATLIMDPDSFQVGRLIGSYGFMNITSYSGFQSSGLQIGSTSIDDFGRFSSGQDVGEGNVKIRLYEGRVTQGPLRGTPVIFKVYPGQQVGGIEADMMAANELNTHSFLQSMPEPNFQNVQVLLGGFETKTGEQWLAFKNDGKYSGADYAKIASKKMAKYRTEGSETFWNPFEKEESIKRRRKFIIKLLQGALRGLAYMHKHERLHQSLGPASVVLNTLDETDAAFLVVRLRDLAFSVDIQYSQLEKPSGLFSEGLWRRASLAGASNIMEKRAFGIADDIYEAGLLLAYMTFIPFCEAGIMDTLSLKRLLETTFQLDVEAMREYCLADDRMLEAVKFLDLGDGAGWELLQAMMNSDFRKRPVAEAVLNHRFLNGSVL